MLRRCYNQQADSYERYGARGVRVCKRWRESFTAFFEWALSHGWRVGLQMERVQNNGPYSPDNCRFATRVENARNRRDNHLVSAFGEIKCLAEWADDPRCLVSYNALKIRLNRRKWDPERALSTQAMPTK